MATYLTFDAVEARQILIDAGVPERQALGYVTVLTSIVQLDLNAVATKQFVNDRLAITEQRLQEELRQIRRLLEEIRCS